MSPRGAGMVVGLAMAATVFATWAHAGPARAVAAPAGSRGTSAASIVAGDAHTCALLADGVVRCWGANSDGQLGDGTTTDRLTPVTVSGLTRVSALAAGGAHTCALVANGTVRCWGFNSQGQLGDGTTTARQTSVAVSGRPRPSRSPRADCTRVP